MKLSDALAMNPEKIKREKWSTWLDCLSHDSLVNLEDMLADDWQVIEKTVPVSRSQLIDLVNKHIAWEFEHTDKFQEILKELELA